MDETASARTIPTLAVSGPWDWDRATDGSERAALAQAIAGAITARRWFGSKTRAVERLEIVDAVAVTARARILLVSVHFAAGQAEVYQVPLTFAERGAAPWIGVQSDDGRALGVLYDALDDAEFCRQLLALFESPRSLRGTAGELVAGQTRQFDALRGEDDLAARGVQAEQSNSSVIYGERLILKAYRRVEMGANPDFEISEFLSRQGFANTPPLAGSLVYRQAGKEPWDLAMLQAFVPNQGDAWQFTLAWLAGALRRFAASANRARELPPIPAGGVVRVAEQPIPTAVRAAFGEFLTSVELLGKRTAEMHLALAADAADGAFAPEAFSEADRRAFSERARDEARETFRLLADQLPRLASPIAKQAQQVLAREQAAHERFEQLARDPVKLDKIRCHGDYHLGQVLVRGGDFVIIDFEGEPARPVGERRQKQLALRDVAGMIRSLHYASCAAATAARAGESAAVATSGAYTRGWYAWTSAAFLAAYRRTAAGGSFLPAAIDQFERLLDGCLLEKAIYELRYELNNRPDWVHLPLAALADLLG
jgi:1,4-alpha-glucan branching enzyme